MPKINLHTGVSSAHPELVCSSNLYPECFYILTPHAPPRWTHCLLWLIVYESRVQIYTGNSDVSSELHTLAIQIFISTSCMPHRHLKANIFNIYNTELMIFPFKYSLSLFTGLVHSKCQWCQDWEISTLSIFPIMGTVSTLTHPTILNPGSHSKLLISCITVQQNSISLLFHNFCPLLFLLHY